jgi:hypothetical protein
MLKKKEWLRRLKQLLSKSELLDNFAIRVIIKSAGEGWKEQLSPGEVAETLINHSELLRYANVAGTGDPVEKEVIFMLCEIYSGKRWI